MTDSLAEGWYWVCERHRAGPAEWEPARIEEFPFPGEYWVQPIGHNAEGDVLSSGGYEIGPPITPPQED